MKKKCQIDIHYVDIRWKMIRYMKIIFFLLFVFSQGYGAVFSQNTKFSVSLMNGSLERVLKSIEEQGDYTFLYSNKDIDDIQEINVDIKNANLKEILDYCLQNTGLSYEINNFLVIIRGRGENPESKGVLVRGIIKDKKGEFLPGVSVMLKGTNIGVATNISGEFEMIIPKLGEVLVFSFIGMNTKEVIVIKDKLEVVLEEKTSDLDEVVIIGYGSVRKKDLTGAISRVNEKLLEESTSNNIGQIIQGQVAGLQILTGSGAPGEPVQLQLRGINSISGSISPLIVVDEVPMPSDFNIMNLNPADIKSIDVLKGASSSAIYGSRAATGVIIITTKRGEINAKPVINYKYTYGTQQLTSKIKTLSADEFKLLLSEATRNSAWEFGYDDITQFGFYKTISEPGFFGNVNTNWMKLLMQSATTQNHELTARGGSKEIQYYASLGYTDEEGLMKNTGYERYNISLNIDSEINPYIKAGLTIRTNISKRSISPITLADAISSRPDLKAYNEDGSYYLHSYDYYGTTWYVKNPLIEQNESNDIVKGFGYNVMGNLEIKILPELKLKAMYSYNRINNEENSYQSSRTQVGSNYWGNKKGRGINTTSNTYQSEFEGRIHYSKIFGKHSIDGIISTSFMRNKSDYRSWAMTDFPDDQVQNAIYQGINYNKNYSGGNDKGAILLSYIARLNYKFMDRYLLTASIRQDGSSRFSPEYRYGNFPSVAIGWIVTEEKFLKENSYLSYLKIRGSYGKTGNESVGEYGWRTLYGASASYQEKPGIVPSQVGNDRLKWESTTQYDLGLDFGLLKNQRISGTLGCYLKETSGVLYPFSLSLGTGMGSTIINLADMQNKGIEFDITARIIDTDKFHWDFGFNIAKNLNKVTGLDQEFVSTLGQAILGNTVLQEGKTMGLFYGYKTDGIFQTWDEVNYCESLNVDHPYQSSASYYRISPGDIKQVDLNGDGYVKKANNSEDLTVLGSSVPDFTGGFNTRFSYQGLTLSIHSTFSYGGQKCWDAEARQFEFSSPMPGNLLNIALDRWTPENPKAKYPKVKVDPESVYFTDYYLHNASFLKIQNISLNYKFPSRWIEKTRILGSSEVFATINNVHTFTNYPGPNPESYNSSNRIAGAAMDYSAYPGVRTYNFGIRVQLK